MGAEQMKPFPVDLGDKGSKLLILKGIPAPTQTLGLFLPNQ
jgi:hypothetical protein